MGGVIEQTTDQGLLRSVDDRPSKTIGLTDFVTDPALLLYKEWTRAAGTWPEWTIVGSFVALAALGVVALRSRRDTETLWQVLGPWLTFMALLLVIGSDPHQRFLSFMIGPMSVILGLGLRQLLTWLVRPNVAQLAAGVVGAVVLTLGLASTASSWRVPWENYAEAVDLAQTYDLEIFSNRTVGTAGFLWYDSSVQALDDVEELCRRQAPSVLLDFPFRPMELPACVPELAVERREVAQRRSLV